MVSIFLSPFISAFNVLFRRITEQGIESTQPVGLLMGCIILILIWSIPNYIYFKHRKHLFSKSSSMAEPHPNNKMPGKIAVALDGDVLPLDKLSAVDVVAETESKKNLIDNDNCKVKSDLKHEENASEQDKIPAKELRALKQLYNAGVLTEKEFSEKKKQLLNI